MNLHLPIPIPVDGRLHSVAVIVTANETMVFVDGRKVAAATIE